MGSRTMCVLLGLVGVGSQAAHAQFVEPDVIVIYTVGGAQDSGQFGLAPAAVGDLNGDGITEIVCTAPGWFNVGPGTTGACFLRDGATGAPMRTHASPDASTVFQKAAAAGDIDSDGVPDYAAAGWNTGSPGTVVVFSGADGSVIHTLGGLTPNDQFGLGLSALDDVNADGFDDLLVGAPFHRIQNVPRGRVAVYSGADGAELWAAEGQAAHEALGQSCFSIDDADGDGIRDVAAGSPQMRPTLQNAGPGFVQLLSGRDGAPIGGPIVSTSPTSVDFGSWIPSPPIDINGDGVREIVIADQFDAALGAQTGKAFVLDGATRALLREYTGSSALQGLGATGSAGDLDGDGIDELIVTSWRSPDGAAGTTGKLEVRRGSDSALLGRVTCDSAGAAFGGWTFGMGDVDLDGVPDIFVNAPWFSGDGPQRGRFWVISGLTFLSCNRADLAAPYGALDFSDVLAFLAAFGASSPVADLAEPLGKWDSTDVVAFLTHFGDGCP